MNRRPRFLRHGRTILIFLFLGVVLNVGVAWGSALMPTTSSDTLLWELLDSTWPTSLNQNYDIDFITRHMAEENFGTQHIRVDGHITSKRTKNSVGQVTISEMRLSGFPFNSFQGERIVFLPSRPSFVVHSNYVSMAESVIIINALDFNIFHTITTKPFLPYQPLWFGFASNTLLYTMILWLLFPGRYLLRRQRRIRRGLCGGCGYIVSVNAGDPNASPNCTECGTPIPGQNQTRSYGGRERDTEGE